MAEQASEDLFSTLMDISDTIREKALTLSENEEPKGIICHYIVFQFVINHLKVFWIEVKPSLQKAMRKRSKSVVKDTSQNDDIESISDTNLPPPELSFTRGI